MVILFLLKRQTFCSNLSFEEEREQKIEIKKERKIMVDKNMMKNCSKTWKIKMSMINSLKLDQHRDAINLCFKEMLCGKTMA